jgi:hypothetical protein
MNDRIVYVELKSGFSDDGPAWIGKARFSKTGRTVYFNGMAFQSCGGQGAGANFRDVESGDEYWISGVKKNRDDRHWAGAGVISIDKSVVAEYLEFVGAESLDTRRCRIVELDNSDIRQRIQKRENRTLAMIEAEHAGAATMEDLRELFDRISRTDFGYPVSGAMGSGSRPDAVAALEARDLPQAYLSFQRECGHIDAREFQNGCWLDDAETLLERLKGDPDTSEVVIGGDGLGASLTMTLADGSVVAGKTSERARRILAPNFNAFLLRLREDWEHFADEDYNWTYMSY